jgi:hypothetical protein
MNELLITENDFRLYAPIPPNLNFERMIVSVIHAQRNFIRAFLGKAQYYDLHTNQTAAKYVTLLGGGTYTVNGQTSDFFGLKPAIVLYAYATFLNDNDMRVTRTGDRVKASDVSENASPEMIQAEYKKALDNAKRYIDEAYYFLTQNASDYPLYMPSNSAGGTNIESVGHSQFGNRRGYQYGANGAIIGYNDY